MKAVLRLLLVLLGVFLPVSAFTQTQALSSAGVRFVCFSPQRTFAASIAGPEKPGS